MALNKNILNGLNTVSYKGFSILANLDIETIKFIISNGTLNQRSMLFQTMLVKDSQIAGDFRKLRVQIGSLDYKIEATPEVKNVIELILNKIDFDSLLQDLTSAIGFGFASFELSWDNVQGIGWIPVEYQLFKHTVIHKEPITNRLYLYNDSLKQIFLDTNELKYLTYVHKSNSGFLEDFGLFNSLVWSFVVTDYIYSHYLNYAELLGIPPIIANGDTSEPDKVLEQILMLRSGNAGIFPKDMEIKLLEATGTGDHFLSVIEYLDKKKSNILLGGNLNSDSGTHGSQSLGEVQQKSKDQILYFDTAILTRFINKFIKTALTYTRFANSEVEFNFIFEDTQTQTTSSASQNNKINLPTINNFVATEKELDPVGHFSDEVLQTENIKKEITSQIVKLLETSNSYEELAENIYLKYENVKFDELVKVLESALFNASALGLVRW